MYTTILFYCASSIIVSNEIIEKSSTTLLILNDYEHNTLHYCIDKGNQSFVRLNTVLQKLCSSLAKVFRVPLTYIM